MQTSCSYIYIRTCTYIITRLYNSLVYELLTFGLCENYVLEGFQVTEGTLLIH